MLVQVGVGESVAGFIQGKLPTTVGSAHYLNKVQQAKNESQVVIENLAL